MNKSVAIRIALPGCYPLLLELNFWHWRREGTHHGAQSKPAVLAVRLVKLNIHEPSEGRRLWVYARGGYAFFFDICLDRRDHA